MADEEVLPQGRGGFIVTRSAKGVHRPAGPWTPTVHAFLEHLTAQGFDGAPMPLGFDDSGREVVSWIEGEVLSDPEWEPGLPTPWPAYAQTEEVLVEAGDLIRRLHEAAATFRPPTPIWKQYAWPMLLEGEIVCHGDLGPHNSVYRDGHLVGLIDWDAIRPNGPDIEFANAYLFET